MGSARHVLGRPANPTLVLALLLALGAGSTSAADQDPTDASPLRAPGDEAAPLLDPCAIAQHYARHESPWGGGTEGARRAPDLTPSELGRRWACADLIEARGARGTQRRFWRFSRTNTSVLVVRLQRWQRRLAFRVGASERDEGGQHHFDGLGELEEDADYGRTFAAANGSLRGDLTLVFGNVGSATTLEDVQEGRANFLDLNPFREIGAQFDLAILEDPSGEGGGVLIFRVRAAYLGLFDRVQGGDSAGVAGESQAGCGLGIKW